jgi:tRNA pseudouridine38-40 synthase
LERYQATLAYDGTAFAGFQAQRGFRTVEGDVQTALRLLGWQGKNLLSGGRTDAGVHAAGQVAAFDMDWPHPVETLQRALNANLPADISCRALRTAAGDFHPRYDAIRRCYRYRLLIAPWPDPLEERYALRVWPAPDEEAMTEAARALCGRRDFGIFGTAPRRGSHTVRTVFRAEWKRSGERLDFWIEADAFLFRMVRTVAGTLLQIGGGRRAPEEMRDLLVAPPKGKPGPAAPARGLCLMRIDYPEGDGTEDRPAPVPDGTTGN